MKHAPNTRRAFSATKRRDAFSKIRAALRVIESEVEEIRREDPAAEKAGDYRRHLVHLELTLATARGITRTIQELPTS